MLDARLEEAEVMRGGYEGGGGGRQSRINQVT